MVKIKYREGAKTHLTPTTYPLRLELLTLTYTTGVVLPKARNSSETFSIHVLAVLAPTWATVIDVVCRAATLTIACDMTHKTWQLLHRKLPTQAQVIVAGDCKMWSLNGGPQDPSCS